LDYFSNKKTIFYETLEKKYTKVMKIFSPLIKGINIKNMATIAVYNCLFLEFIKFNFNLDYSKYLSLQTKNLALDNLKYQVVGSIKKIGFILNGDNWKRVALHDDHEYDFLIFRFFSTLKIQEIVPINYRNFLTVFNEVKVMNKSNICNIFNKYIDNIEKFKPDENSKIEILSKPIDNRNLILSSSTVTMIKSLLECVIHLLIYDSLAFEIFLHIFNIFDYYILACVNMFIDKKTISLLFEEINPDEVKKKPNKLESLIDTILFQKKYTNLRGFFLKAKKNLEILFNVQLDLLKNNYENESYDITEFNLPKMNSEIIVSDSNSYVLMIESIIAFESIYSVYKIVKRLKVSTKVIYALL
jgi:hypothetical protein